MSTQYMLASDNLTREQIRKYNVSELQAILTELNLPSTGKKHELVERVFQFWLELQSPSKENAVNPTNSLRFTITTLPDIYQLRSLLLNYGNITAILVDPAETTCYVIFNTINSAQKFHDDCPSLGYEHCRYVHESDIEKRVKELQLIKENAFITNVSLKQFSRTKTEPKIFWKPKNPPMNN